ncbi:hypothetical protein O181_038522 [Austropuccinia psidii MF-1]|uniref:Uncharacterized protein n=1 Tax=Austropuccinia psidii MF-1 TaxID=1389203 RepID=A0A9Q3HBZ6_9BASI|nr:hypothetical protein [Austropuccinia psidii MF-1]
MTFTHSLKTRDHHHHQHHHHHHQFSSIKLILSKSSKSLILSKSLKRSLDTNQSSLADTDPSFIPYSNQSIVTNTSDSSSLHDPNLISFNITAPIISNNSNAIISNNSNPIITKNSNPIITKNSNPVNPLKTQSNLQTAFHSLWKLSGRHISVPPWLPLVVGAVLVAFIILNIMAFILGFQARKEFRTRIQEQRKVMADLEHQTSSQITRKELKSFTRKSIILLNSSSNHHPPYRVSIAGDILPRNLFDKPSRDSVVIAEILPPSASFTNDNSSLHFASGNSLLYSYQDSSHPSQLSTLHDHTIHFHHGLKDNNLDYLESINPNDSAIKFNLRRGPTKQTEIFKQGLQITQIPTHSTQSSSLTSNFFPTFTSPQPHESSIHHTKNSLQHHISNPLERKSSLGRGLPPVNVKLPPVACLSPDSSPLSPDNAMAQYAASRSRRASPLVPLDPLSVSPDVALAQYASSRRSSTKSLSRKASKSSMLGLLRGNGSPMLESPITIEPFNWSDFSIIKGVAPQTGTNSPPSLFPQGAQDKSKSNSVQSTSSPLVSLKNETIQSFNHNTKSINSALLKKNQLISSTTHSNDKNIFSDQVKNNNPFSSKAANKLSSFSPYIHSIILEDDEENFTISSDQTTSQTPPSTRSQRTFSSNANTSYHSCENPISPTRNKSNLKSFNGLQRQKSLSTQSQHTFGGRPSVAENFNQNPKNSNDNYYSTHTHSTETVSTNVIRQPSLPKNPYPPSRRSTSSSVRSQTPRNPMIDSNPYRKNDLTNSTLRTNIIRQNSDKSRLPISGTMSSGGVRDSSFVS